MKPVFAVFLLVISVAIVSADESSLTLEEAIAKALAGNPSIEASSETAKASGYKVGQAASGYMPQASVSLGYQRSTSNSGAMPDSDSQNNTHESSDSYNNFSATLNLEVPIWDFGRTMGTHKSAKALKESSGFDLTTTVEDTIFYVIQGYYAVLATQDALFSATDNKAKMEKHLELAKTQVAAGLRQKIDVLRAQSDLASADLALVQAKNARSQARLNLATIIGISDTGFTAIRSEVNTDIPDTNIDEAVKLAMQKRPEYKSLMAKIKASDGTITASKSGYFPTLSANGSVGYSGFELPDMAYNWTVGASLSWNFFSGLGTMNSVNESLANKRALLAQLKSLELSIKNDIGTALISLSEAQEKIGPAELFLTSASETLTLAEERYAAGLGNIVEITDSQLLYTQARIQKIQADYDLDMAKAKYLKSIGKISEFTKNGQ
ncbi:MAG TPA: TolC family protein [bacterium]|nr:TolC family protein [bacterium]